MSLSEQAKADLDKHCANLLAGHHDHAWTHPVGSSPQIPSAAIGLARQKT
jgi:hypothetical protein